MPSIEGKCLCGCISYAVDKLEESMGNCHCKMCRKFHGAAYATYAQAKRENFHWLSGENFSKAMSDQTALSANFVANVVQA